MADLRLPRLRPQAITVWRRNVLVWRKLIGPALVMNFGEPVLYLLGLGYGLGFFIGNMSGMPYLTFLASGILASSAMTTSTFEGMYSVYTRMVPQKTYDAILTTPVDLDDILAGEILWCGTKSLISGLAILLVAAVLGAVVSWEALLALPVIFLTGLCFAGPAVVMSALSPGYDFFNYYFALGVTPMFMLCGVFYPIETLPAGVQNFVQILPLTHAVALTRPLVAGGAVHHASVHLLVLAGYALAGYYLAVVLARRRLLV